MVSKSSIHSSSFAILRDIMITGEWEKLDATDVLKVLSSSRETGLGNEEVLVRQRRDGKNVLRGHEKESFVGKVLRQFRSPLVFILFVAGIATILLAEYIDSTVIFIALLINVVIGLFQEGRASQAFEKLNQSQEHYSVVIRGGVKQNILSEELVQGDIVEVEGGRYVPADLRILSEKGLALNESSLTGEWVAVSKDTATISQAPLAERRNMAWRGTLVAEGYGVGVVVATGDKTEIGKIAREVGSIKKHATPLQQNIRNIARFLSYIVIGSITIIFFLGIFRGETIGEMLLVTIAVAVATVPSGLPAAVTIVLALGMEKILERGGLVRNLLAAETLGATTIILTDKTGTLTEAKMRLSSIFAFDTLGRKKELLGWTNNEREVLTMAVMASDAFVEEKKEGENTPTKLVVHGRPIERAVVLAGLEVGISQNILSEKTPRLDYLQFESKRRYGGSLHRYPEKESNRFYMTGSPEMLLEKASYIFLDGKREKLTDTVRAQFTKIQQKHSKEGERFIAVTYKDVKWDIIPNLVENELDEELTKGMVFVGFLSFNDPVRADVPEAIKEVKHAGARVLMVTGDNPQTALNIAIAVGIAKDKSEVKTGKDIEKCNDEELYQLIKENKVFARTLPNQKLRIARILKNKDEIVAMTGDGVNDAPALRSADIGIAVGSGTEVAKEASDIILLNNSFSIIVSAIEEGRRIIDNLKKIVAYLLSTSFSEIFVIGGALAIGAPLPLLPAQILWANIIEEGLMSFSFAFEKKAPGIMRRDPRESASRNIMTPRLRQLIVIVGVTTGVFLIGLYLFLLSFNLPIEEIRTIMFVALSLDALFFSFSLKSLDRPIWKINMWSNRFLLVAFSVSVLLLLAAVSMQPLRTLLSLTPLTAFDILFLVGVGFFNLMTIELAKYFIFERGMTR